MKQSKKSLLGVLLCTALLAGGLTGCGDGTSSSEGTPASGTSSGSSSTGGAPAELTEISVMVFDRGNIPEGEGTIDNNRWTQWLNEKMNEQGVSLKFMPIPRSEEGQKIPVLMASGTAADIMETYSSEIVHQYYLDGGTYDLKSYIDEYGSQLKEYVGEECLAAGRTEDGAQFAVPARRSTLAQTNCFIRKDWLDQLGMAVPATVDELYSALKAFKEQDPGGVGSSLIAFAGPTGAVLNYAFLEEMDDTHYLANAASRAYGDPGYREYLRFRNTLYNEGLMDPEYFAATSADQKSSEDVVSGRLGYWETMVNSNVDPLRGGMLQNLKQNVPEAEFVSIPPVKNINDGKQYNPCYAPTGAYVFVPKTAKSPEACIKYLNFLAGEGGFTVYHGFEGEHYNMVDGQPVVIDADHNAQTKDYTRHDLFLVGNQGYFATEDDFSKTTAKENPEWESYVLENYENAAAGTRLPSSTYVSPTQVEQSGNIGKIKDDYEVQLTTCKPDDFDGLYDQYLAELEKYDVEKILEERIAYFEANPVR